jgi:hypothetical protein
MWWDLTHYFTFLFLFFLHLFLVDIPCPHAPSFKLNKLPRSIVHRTARLLRLHDDNIIFLSIQRLMISKLSPHLLLAESPTRPHSSICRSQLIAFRDKLNFDNLIGRIKRHRHHDVHFQDSKALPAKILLSTISGERLSMSRFRVCCRGSPHATLRLPSRESLPRTSPSHVCRTPKALSQLEFELSAMMEKTAAFKATRLTPTVFKIVEFDDVFSEHPFIYVKVLSDVIIVVDTGCGGRGATCDVDVTSLRESIEEWGVEDNGGRPLNEGVKRS